MMLGRAFRGGCRFAEKDKLPLPFLWRSFYRKDYLTFSDTSIKALFRDKPFNCDYFFYILYARSFTFNRTECDKTKRERALHASIKFGNCRIDNSFFCSSDLVQSR